MIFPSEDEYLKLSCHYRLVPVSAEWGADMETPISLFTRCVTGGPSFLLESVEGGEKLARYSFIGLDPLALYRHKGRRGQIFLPAKHSRGLIDALKASGIDTGEIGTANHLQGHLTGPPEKPAGLLFTGPGGDEREIGKECLEVEGNPFTVVEQMMGYWLGPRLPELPRFYGGAVGYFGYDLVRWLERLPSGTRDDLDLPDMVLFFTGTLLILDHLRHTLRVVVNTLPESNREAEYRRAVRSIEEIWQLLNRPLTFGSMPSVGLSTGTLDSERVVAGGEAKQPIFTGGFTEDRDTVPELTANLTRAEFMSLVTKAREYIRQGEILQVVLSQRLQVPFMGNPFQVYRRLRRINPSPYMYYLDTGDVVIAGSSPEMLVRVEEDEVETRPIAGTRPRGATAPGDEALERDLLADPKERAEHVMLVDLGRNDLGRVCTPGSVTVPQFMTVEKYSHVMHLVSSVRGTLSPGRSAFDALKACFPAGTVSGAPKVRAMEIIDELEPVRRGPYAGAVGYLGFNGNLDTAITIRTVVFHQGRAYVQAGAGIVADSDPEGEYQETLNKARALLQTLGHRKRGILTD